MSGIWLPHRWFMQQESSRLLELPPALLILAPPYLICCKLCVINYRKRCIFVVCKHVCFCRTNTWWVKLLVNLIATLWFRFKVSANQINLFRAHQQHDAVIKRKLRIVTKFPLCCSVCMWFRLIQSIFSYHQATNKHCVCAFVLSAFECKHPWLDMYYFFNRSNAMVFWAFRNHAVHAHTFIIMIRNSHWHFCSVLFICGTLINVT